MYEDRVERAKELHKQGCNCSQAVVAAFADLYGMDERTALRLSSPFGGGIGQMRETCGAACGLFMLAGLEGGTDDPSDRESKAATYKTVQRLAARFRDENGSLICGELLGLRPAAVALKKRPCTLMVESAARIFADYLEERRR